MAGPTNNINDANAQIRQDALETASIVEEALRSIADSVSTAFENALGTSNTVSQAVAKDLQKSFNTLGKVSKETASNITKLQNGLLKSKAVQEQINKRKSEELAAGLSLAAALKAQGATLGSIDDLIDKTTGELRDQEAIYQNLDDTQKSIVQQYSEALKYSQEQTKELQKQAEQAKKIEDEREKSLGVSGKILKTLGGIKGLGDASAKSQKELTEYAEKYRKETGKYPSQMHSFGKAITLAGKSFVKGLLDPAVIAGGLFTAIVKTFKDVDKAAGDTAKGMNMSYSEAVKFRGELKEAADASNSQYITSKGLLETNLAINSALGTSVKLSDKNVQAFTELRVTAGLTNEELMGIQALTLTNGKSLEQNTGEIMAQAKITGMRNGVLLNEKEVLKGIKDISAATTLTLGKNPKLLAQAAATAKSLGMEMSQVESISNSLLDFQSSIENELSAELLTGKQLNLETARYAALTGDVATVASEVAAQLGSAAEFGEMNRLQQEAIAKSVGMGREELAKTLYVQEQLKGVSGDIAKEEEELLNKRIEQIGLAQAQEEYSKKGFEGLKQQADMATQFNMVVEKLQESFVAVAIAIMPFVEGVASAFGLLSKIPGLIPAILTGLIAMKALSAAVAAKQIITAIASGWTAAMSGPESLLTGGLAGLAIGAGITAAIIAATSTANDLYSAGGYGKRTLVAPEGVFRLNDNDNIVATTNPINANDLISGPKGSMRPTSTQQSGQAMNSQINIAPSNTNVTLSLDGMAIGNANAKQDYGVSKNIKAFGGGFDYSA